MPAWPTPGNFNQTHTDAGSDSPASARPQINAAMGDLAAVIAARGSANGVASLDGTGRLPTGQLPSITPIQNGIQSWDDAGSYSWTVPTGVSKVIMQAAGAGGGGGFGANNGTNSKHGGGGGAGGCLRCLLEVEAGDVFTISVGAGGAGGNGPTNADGSDGGDTTITVTRGAGTRLAVTVIGGLGGKSNALVSPGPTGGDGSGGNFSDTTALIGHVFFAGGTGGTGVAEMAGMGGSNFYTGSSPGPSGFGFGGGGYGSGTGGPTSAIGGKDGGVLLEW